MAPTLLVSKEWKTRAPLRAQLIEEGLDVEASETVGEALLDLDSRPALPALIVADLSTSDDPALDEELLASWSKEIPIWIIAGHTILADKTLKDRGFEMVLTKPMDVGELVKQITRRLKT